MLAQVAPGFCLLHRFLDILAPMRSPVPFLWLASHEQGARFGFCVSHSPSLRFFFSFVSVHRPST